MTAKGSRVMFLALLGMLVLGLGSPCAYGQTQKTTALGMSVTVAGTCRFQNTGAISFTLNPAAGGDVIGAVTQPTFWCTSGVSYTIIDDFGVNEATPNTAPRRMKGPGAGGTEYIEYSFNYTATGTGSGPSTPITMNIASTVVGSQYTSKSAGTYTDTVTLTITP